MIARCVSGMLAALVAGFVMAEEDEVLPYPSLGQEIAAHLQRHYYDPGRFRPQLMLEKAMQALEAGAPEVVIHRFDSEQLRMQIRNQELFIPARRPEDLQSAMAIIDDIRLRLEAHPDFGISEGRDLGYSMLNAAVRTLDPHTMIFPPAPADDFWQSVEGTFFGIGAYLSESEDGSISIDRVMPGLPAEKSGIKDGDAIILIDGENATGLSLRQAIKRIKGPRGTTVTLHVEREGHEGLLAVPIVRDLIEAPVLRSYKQQGVGYIRLDDFTQNADTSIYQELMKLKKEGDLRGVIIDLRFNGGGILPKVVNICDLFLPKDKEIVRTVELNQRPLRRLSGFQAQIDVPVMILTSPGSASASEILAGAMQINDRAAVIGSTTFGKGSVQTGFGLGDGGNLKYTISEYQLADGASIQGVGVVPDILLTRHRTNEQGRVDLVPFTSRREADDQYSLRQSGSYEHQVEMQLGWVQEYEGEDARASYRLSAEVFLPDQEARLAIELMAEALAERVPRLGDTANMRQALLEQLRLPVQRRRQQESADLAAALAAEANGRRVWELGGGPELLLEYLGPASVRAGEGVELRFRLSNRSRHDRSRLYGMVSSDRMSPFWEDEVIFGAVPAGAKTEGTLFFQVPKRIYDGEERFTLQLFQEGEAAVLAELPVSVRMEAQPRPRFALSWELQDSDGNGQVNLDEDVTIRCRLENVGDGDSIKLVSMAYKADNAFVQLGQGSWFLDPVLAGDSASIDIPLSVRSALDDGSSFSGDSVVVDFRAYEDFGRGLEGSYRAGIDYQIEVPINSKLGTSRVLAPSPRLVDCVDRGQGRRQLRIAVEDDNVDYLTVFRDKDKVCLATADQMIDGQYVIDIELEDGVNPIRVLAHDEDDIIGGFTQRLWHEVEYGAPPLSPLPSPAPARNALP